MLQNTRKTMGFKKIMVYEIPPGGGDVNHIWPAVYIAHHVQIWEPLCAWDISMLFP